MKTKSLHLASAALVAALIAPEISFAAGARKQAFASTSGVDAANCGASDNPCRTLQYAIDNALAAGGVLYLKTPGDYRPATIVTSVTIINASGGAAGVFKTRDMQAAISIPATSPIAVKLRGLTLDGGGVSMLTSFAVDAAKSRLAMTDCVVQNAARGLSIQPTSGVSIGAYVAGGSFRNVEVGVDGGETRDATLSPFAIDSTTVTSASLDAYRIGMIDNHAAITNSSAFASSNGLNNINISNMRYLGAKTVLDRFTSNGNRTGARILGGGMMLSRASILANTAGLELDNSPYGSGPNQTFQNNLIAGNGTDIGGDLPALAPVALQ